jgi:hypothetical protein
LTRLQFEQIALRKKEDEEQRAEEYRKKSAVRATYDEMVKLRREKHEKLKREENIFDLAWLEDLVKSSNDEEKEQLQRKVCAMQQF